MRTAAVLRTHRGWSPPPPPPPTPSTPSPHTEGVALMMAPEAHGTLIGWEPVNSRIITAKFTTKKKDISWTGEPEGHVSGDQKVDGQIPAERQASEEQEREPTENNQRIAETMGRTLQGTAEPPNPSLTNRHPIRRDRTAYQLRQTPKGRDQEDHHDSEKWEGCRTGRDTSRSHQSRHRDSCQHATQPLQQVLEEGEGTGPVERRHHHQAAKK